MSVAQQAIRRRRNARMDQRYCGGKADPSARARRYSKVLEKQKAMVQRKASKK